jgi:DNA-binding NarL/FixJ family response regulator
MAELGHETTMGTAYVLCDDMIFTSRITATARALGLEAKSARSIEKLMDLVRSNVPDCVIVDLANPGLDIQALNQQLRQAVRPPRVIAFGSHVDTASLQAARAAGCDVVLPRSKFTEDLDKSLPAWVA